MLGQVIYELTRGLAYRSISHPGMRMYNTWLPIIISVLSTALYIAVPQKLSLLGSDGFSNQILSIIATLPGFYFAGLAAVATLGNADMDKVMPDPAPTIQVLVKGVYISNELTRRQYLSYLFSYLVFVSFLSCIIILFANLSSPSLEHIRSCMALMKYGSFAASLTEIFVVFVMSLMLSAMGVTTLQGLFFLTEKMHQP